MEMFVVKRKWRVYHQWMLTKGTVNLKFTLQKVVFPDDNSINTEVNSKKIFFKFSHLWKQQSFKKS